MSLTEEQYQALAAQDILTTEPAGWKPGDSGYAPGLESPAILADDTPVDAPAQTMSEIAAKTLGDSTSYAVFTDQFDPSLLNPMPRLLAREQWGITGREFIGCDVWHCHEATFLLDNGYPVAGTLKFVYQSDSEYMVESKSAKLYLNSFDMCRLGPTLDIAIAAYEANVKRDLENIIQSRVDVKFHHSVDFTMSSQPDPLRGYEDVHVLCPNLQNETFTDYFGNEHHVALKNGHGATRFYTNALRSRCRHTKQKDTGLAAIYHDGQHGRTIDETSVFKQIVGLREVNEFHEFCAEKLFVEIKRVIHPQDELLVMLLYSRRGSLDINPVRATSFGALPKDLVNANILTEKVQGQ